MVNILAWLLPLVLYGVLGTVVVLVGVLCGVAIWWLRQASSLLPWLSLGIAPCFLMYAVYLSLKPTWVGVLVLAGVVFFSVELILETSPSGQDVRRSRAARLGSSTAPVEEEARPREVARQEKGVQWASGAHEGRLHHGC
jgi:hypothetical protein